MCRQSRRHPRCEPDHGPRGKRGSPLAITSRMLTDIIGNVLSAPTNTDQRSFRGNSVIFRRHWDWMPGVRRFRVPAARYGGLMATTAATQLDPCIRPVGAHSTWPLFSLSFAAVRHHIGALFVLGFPALRCTSGPVSTGICLPDKPTIFVSTVIILFLAGVHW